MVGTKLLEWAWTTRPYIFPIGSRNMECPWSETSLLYIFLILTLYPTYRWLGGGKLVVKHFVLQFSSNFRDVVSIGTQRRAFLVTGARKWKHFLTLSGNRTHILLIVRLCAAVPRPQCKPKVYIKIHISLITVRHNHWLLI